MYGKTEVLDETCSQTFLRKLKQNLNNFVPKIRVIYQNQKTAKVLIFYKKRFLEKAWSHNLNLLRISATAVISRSFLFD